MGSPLSVPQPVFVVLAPVEEQRPLRSRNLEPSKCRGVRQDPMRSFTGIDKYGRLRFPADVVKSPKVVRSTLASPLSTSQCVECLPVRQPASACTSYASKCFSHPSASMAAGRLRALGCPACCSLLQSCGCWIVAHVWLIGGCEEALLWSPLMWTCSQNLLWTLSQAGYAPRDTCIWVYPA